MRRDEEYEEEVVEEIEEIELDPIQVERYMNKLRKEQNFSGGLIAGLASAIIGAMVWAGVTYATNMKIGLIALAIGMFVGYAVRLVGKGLDDTYRYIGAVCALLGCAAGNVLMVAVVVSKSKGIPLMDLLMNFKFITLVFKNSSVMDFVFYAIAIYEGYTMSLREIDPEDLLRFARR